MVAGRTAQTWGAALEAMEAGKRNPRVLAMDVLKQVKRSTAWLSARWSVSMTTPDPYDDPITGVRQHRWRRTRPDELPENNPAEWQRLCEQAGAIRYSMELLEDFALREKERAQRWQAEHGSKDVA